MTNREEAITDWYRQFGDGIRKVCLAYTGDRMQADDLLQETFIRAWKNWDKFRGDSKVSTWIYRIAINTCLSFLRDQKEKTVDIEKTAVSNLPDESSVKEQQIALLYKCINQLAETDRLVITMVLNEQEYEDIAEVTGITENNLRVKIHRIKKELSEIYNRYERL